MRIALLAAALLAAMPLAAQPAAPPAGSPAGSQGPRGSVVLVILAHPDDELVIAPALARAAREGARVRVAYATSGDRGTAYSGLQAGAQLATLREGEARCAAQALGIEEPDFWQLGDGTLADAARSAEKPTAALLDRIARAIALARPSLVITWGADGGYGHADHRMISALVTQTVQAQDAGRPLLFYPGMRAGTLPDILVRQGWAATEPSLLAVRAPYAEADLAAAHAAVQCHASQFSAEERAGLAPLFHASVWQGAVHFRDALGSSVREDALFLSRPPSAGRD